MLKLLLVNAYREMRNWFLETGGKESLLFNGRKLSSIEAFSCMERLSRAEIQDCSSVGDVLGVNGMMVPVHFG